MMHSRGARGGEPGHMYPYGNMSRERGGYSDIYMDNNGYIYPAHGHSSVDMAHQGSVHPQIDPQYHDHQYVRGDLGSAGMEMGRGSRGGGGRLNDNRSYHPGYDEDDLHDLKGGRVESRMKMNGPLPGAYPFRGGGRGHMEDPRHYAYSMDEEEMMGHDGSGKGGSGMRGGSATNLPGQPMVHRGKMNNPQQFLNMADMEAYLPHVPPPHTCKYKIRRHLSFYCGPCGHTLTILPRLVPLSLLFYNLILPFLSTHLSHSSLSVCAQTTGAIITISRIEIILKVAREEKVSVGCLEQWIYPCHSSRFIANKKRFAMFQ